MHSSNLSIPITIFFACATLAACGSPSDDAEGIAIGLHAVVVGPDGELTSNELEVSLGRTILSDSNREDTPEPTATARIVLGGLVWKRALAHAHRVHDTKGNLQRHD
tara:strand:- start:88518 stop:88838 length:321 start_codon:yes stop_codon:yes gene_type:complete